MKHKSLFSGIGGFDLAAEWMGWENISHTEWNDFGQKVLKYHWPNAQSHGDITKTDYTIYRGRVDILTGGFPCQPYSVAGKRKGKDDERHLWPEMLRAIREIAPSWVVGENVGGLINWNGGMVFNEVQADLEAEGYEILPFLLPAAGVNAPHKRDRIWFVAYSTSSAERPSGQGGESEGFGSEKYNEQESRGIEAKLNNVCRELLRVVVNSHDTGSCTGPETISETNGEISERHHDAKPCNTCVARFPANTPSTRQPGKEHRETESGWVTEKSIQDDWQNFPTQSPVCDGDDGFPTESLRQFFRDDSNGVISEEEIDKILYQAYSQWRNETIKAGGNAIVPQVVYQIFKAIEQYELQK